jgi:hypothetical protein
MANAYNNTGTFGLTGGLGGIGGVFNGNGSNGGDGVLTVILPEPSSLVLLATALPMVAYALRRRKSA